MKNCERGEQVCNRTGIWFLFPPFPLIPLFHPSLFTVISNRHNFCKALCIWSELLLSPGWFLWIRPLLTPIFAPSRLNLSIKQVRTEVHMGQMGKHREMTQQYSSAWLVSIPAVLSVTLGFLDISAKRNCNKEWKWYFRYSYIWDQPAAEVAEFTANVRWQFKAKRSLVTLHEDNVQDGESVLLYGNTCGGDGHFCWWVSAKVWPCLSLRSIS